MRPSSIAQGATPYRPRAFHFLTEAYPALAKKLLHSVGSMVSTRLPMCRYIFDGSLLSGTHPVFDLGESLLDRLEVGE